MAKSRDAFRTISEVADWLETPAHVLRFWESKFPQIKPVKRAGGRRYYRPEDMALLGGIKTLLHDQGMTIKGAQKMIRDMGVRHVAALGPQPEIDDSDDSDDSAVEGMLAPSHPDVATAAAARVAPTTFPAGAMLRKPARPLPEGPATRATARQESLLALVLGADLSRLRGKSAAIVPLVARLERLRDMMRQDRA